jgi:preprotein translocase YajC subunit
MKFFALFSSSFFKKLIFSFSAFVLSNSICLADAGVGQESGFSGFVKNWTGYVPILLVFGVFYFLVIRPQNKKRKALEEMIKNIKTGDHIVTHSGIFGSVSECAERHFKLEVSKGVKIKMLKSAIAFVESSSKAEHETTEA